MEDSRADRHDRCVFCGGFWLLFFSLAGTGPVHKVYVPDTARIVISHRMIRLGVVLTLIVVVDCCHVISILSSSCKNKANAANLLSDSAKVME